MIRSVFLITILLYITISCSNSTSDKRILPSVPKGTEALSVTGQPLNATAPSPSATARLKSARDEWRSDKNSADKLIWYGRWTAYNGMYREAIRIFSKGISEHPSDARMLRHRGHRYISIREFDRAIEDFEKAALLVAFLPDEVEPDGMPNELNIPVSTLKSNIFYHLGLAHYLKGDREKALEAWTSDLSLATNDDMKVATLHWVYMTLMEMGRETEAAEAVSEVSADMNIIENHAYHKICLFYKGILSLDVLTGIEYSDIMNDAMLYGIGNWYLYTGDRQNAQEYFGKILSSGAWASFGYIAAEVKTSEMQVVRE
jgi:tetratricopeptide (TPR) repeat protein